MHSEYGVDPKYGVLRFTGHPDSSFEDRVKSIADMIADADLPKDAQVLMELSAVKSAPSIQELEAVRLLVYRIQNRFHGKVAIVNSRVGHHTLSIIAALWTSNEGCKAFTAERDALFWLNAK